MNRNRKTRSWRYSIFASLVAPLVSGFLNTSAQAQNPVWKPMHLTTPAQLAAGELGGEGCQRPQMIEMDQVDGQLIFFGTDVGGLFRSTDGGNTFEASNQGIETTGVVDVKVDPKNKNRVILIGDGGGNQYNVYGGVYLSTNQGATWSRKNSRWLDALGTGGRQNGRDQVAFDLSSYDSGLNRCQTIYWVSEDDKQDSKGALWKSNDGGSNWWKKAEDTQYGGADDAYSLIEVHPTLGYVYIANKNGLYRSTDGGGTFTQIMSGNFKSLDVVPSAPNTVWAAKGSTLYKSTNSGASFSTVSSSGIANIYHLKVSPVNNNHMVAGDSGNDNKPYYSTNGGTTWTASAMDMSEGWIPSSIQPMNRVCSRVWHPTNANIIFSTGKGDQLMKSTNKGANFVYSGNGINNVMIGHGFSFNYHNLDLVYLGFQDYNGGMTTDGGKSWTHVNLPTGDNWGWVRSAYAVSSQKYFGIDENYGSGTFDLWYTANGGANKTKKVSNIGGLRICYGDPTDSNVLFAGNRRSSNGGSTWQVMSGCKGVFIHDFSNNDLYGANDKNVVKSTNKGATWTTIATMASDVTDIAYDHVNDRLWVTAGDKLYQCNGPAYSPSQKSISGCPASTVAIDPNDTNTIYVGGTNGTWRRQDNHVMRSTNGGSSFHKLVQQNGAYGPDGGSNAEWIRVHPLTGEAWVATNCHGMWKFGLEGGDIGYEAEDLPVWDSAHPTVKAGGAMSAGYYSFIETCVVNDFIEYEVNVATAGTYTIKIGASEGPSRAKWQLAVNGTNVGAEFDAYDSSWKVTEVNRGSVSLNAGINVFTFTITGKNANATGWNIGFDYIKTNSTKHEAENLPVWDSAHPTVKAGGAMSNGYYSFIETCVVDDFIEYEVEVTTSGTYNIRIGASEGPSRAKWQLSVNGTDQGGEFDAYSSSWGVTEVDRGSLFLTAGTHVFTFTITGKNSNATGWNIGFDYIDLLWE